ncbi:MAG: hypothetical protein AAF639_00720 [Chloroflexota bacterium]
MLKLEQSKHWPARTGLVICLFTISFFVVSNSTTTQRAITSISPLIPISPLSPIAMTSGNQSISTDSSNELVQIIPKASLPLAPWHKLSSFQIKDEFAYLAVTEISQETSRLDIFDITSPAKPQLHNSLPIQLYEIQCVDISENHLVIAGSTDKDSIRERFVVFIYDMTNRDTPVLIAERDFQNECNALKIIQDHIYIATYWQIIVIDSPYMQSLDLIPHRGVEHIITHENTEFPLTLIGGYCGGKWGCTTTLESVYLSTPASFEVIATLKWGSYRPGYVTIWGDNLALTGNLALQLRKIRRAKSPSFLCSIHYQQSVLAPVHSGVHFIGAYGFHLTDDQRINGFPLTGAHRIMSINFSNVYFPQQGPEAIHPIKPSALAHNGKFIYIVDRENLTAYETLWQEIPTPMSAVTDLSQVKLSQKAMEELWCIENEVQLADTAEYEALWAIHRSLGGANWHYTGQIGAGQTYQDYSEYGSWPIKAPPEDGQPIQLSESETPCGWKGITCSCDGHIQKISLAVRNAQGDVPPEIGNLSRLTHLGFGYSFGHITSLPPEIGKLTNLQSLDLYHSGVDPNAEALALPNVCIFTHKGSTGPGCHSGVAQEPKLGCTFRP